MTAPTPDAYTRCIGCGADFYPPNGTDLCPLRLPKTASPTSPPG